MRWNRYSKFLYPNAIPPSHPCFNPCSPEGFSQTYFTKGGCCNPPWIINTEGHITLNLLPVYRYNGHPLSIDAKKVLTINV